MGSRGKPIFIGLIIAATIAGGLYYFLRPEPVKEETQPESTVSSRMAFSGTNMTESQDGQKIWDLTAQVMEVDTKTTWVYMTGLKGTIFRTDGTQIEVTAPNAVVDPKDKNIELSGGIRMKATDGTSFSADQGRYAGKERKIFASGSIKVIREDAVLTARELETDDQFELIVVRGNARIVKGGPVQ